MRDCLYGKIRVRYYDLSDEIREIPDDIDFVLAKTEPDNIERIEILKNQNFVFHDRTVLGEIRLLSVDENLFRMIRADVRTDREFSQDIYELAGKCFVKDRRFHLTKYFNQELANKILKGYIGTFSGEEIRLFKCFHKNILVGFTIVKRLNETTCENVLGAVDPAYQSKGAAVNLYAYMVKTLRNDGCVKLRGRISTTNTASLNLHIALGAKYREPEDDYIFRGKRSS